MPSEVEKSIVQVEAQSFREGTWATEEDDYERCVPTEEVRIQRSALE